MLAKYCGVRGIKYFRIDKNASQIIVLNIFLLQHSQHGFGLLFFFFSLLCSICTWKYAMAQYLCHRICIWKQTEFDMVLIHLVHLKRLSTIFSSSLIWLDIQQFSHLSCAYFCGSEVNTQMCFFVCWNPLLQCSLLSPLAPSSHICTAVTLIPWLDDSVYSS